MIVSDRLAHHDYEWSAKLNQLSQQRVVGAFFRGVSRIGDGIIWYVIIFALPLAFGPAGLRTSVALALAAVSGVLIYKVIKLSFKRPRPFRQHDDIKANALVLDEWSFPSGHTLHATAFSIILLAYIPILGLLFLPFAGLTALSRIILGLHYPSDVVVGAIIGAALANSVMVVSELWF